MPSVLRSRLALIALMGAFLIPIGLSSLRGLTHVLTCQERTDVPFTLSIPTHGRPTISSSATITRKSAAGLCGGLTLNMRVGAQGPGKVKIVLPIVNHTKYRWHGSVKLELGGTTGPVRISSIGSGSRATGTTHAHGDPGP